MGLFPWLMEAVPRTSKTKPNLKKKSQQQNTLLMISDDSIDFFLFSLHFVLRGDFFLLFLYFIRANDIFPKAGKEHLLAGN